MEQIVRWLKGIEKKAESVYRASAERLRNDEDLHRRLLKLAEEEALHFQMMERADEYLKSAVPKPESAFLLDRETRERVEKHFQDCQEKLSADRFHERDVLSCIARTEFSEWNKFFVYVVGSMKQAGREFEHAAAMVQRHRADVEDLLDSRGFDDVGMIQGLSTLWKTKILIVDDTPQILEMLELVLESEGEVVTAEDGEQGLKMMEKSYFDVIISDLKMPNMGGIDFYMASREQLPFAEGHFLFFAGDPTREEEAFMDRNGLSLIRKPSRIRQIRRAVREIIQKGRPEGLPSH